jgi:thiamine pyrophosphokinase
MNPRDTAVGINPRDTAAQGGRGRGLLIVGGAGPDRHELAEYARGMDVIVAADSGLDAALAAGIRPAFVVGDMDSLSDRALLDQFPPERVLLFARDKDETDTEIGMRTLRESGCDDITIAGGAGGRIDHLLGIAALFERDAPPRRWLTDREDIRLVEGAADFAGWQGATVSVFPLGDRAADMHSEGLRWPLDGLEFKRGYGGISNLVAAERVRITVGIGRLLVVRSLSNRLEKDD